MIIGKVSKEMLDCVFEQEKERQKLMHFVLAAEDESEQEKYWANVRSLGEKINGIIEAYIGDKPIMTWENYIFEQLFKAVGYLGKERFIKVLEIYDIGVSGR